MRSNNKQAHPVIGMSFLFLYHGNEALSAHQYIKPGHRGRSGCFLPVFLQNLSCED